MKIHRLMIGCAMSCAWICAPSSYASPDSADRLHEKNRAMLDSWLGRQLETIPIHVEPKVVVIADPIVRDVFQKYDFFGVYMPRWPRAITPPEGLSYETIVVLCAGEFVQAIRGNDELKSFLSKTLSEVTNEDKARTVAQAALVLVAYGSSSGPFDLKAPVVSATRESNGVLAMAQAEVREPARGEIKVTLQFDAAGVTTADAITIAGAVRPQPPPR